MSLSLNEQVAALDAPLARSRVSQRSQSGRSLSYIEAWWAISEANRIFGHDGWNRELLNLKLLGEPRLVKNQRGEDQWRVAYMATVRITHLHFGCFRDGSGFGSGIDKDVDQAHESALKEAESDAMKRALMTFGNPFGLALYDKTQANVSDGQSAVNPSPPGPDFPGSEGSPGRSSYAAKKDGGSERFAELRVEIAGLDSMVARGMFIKERKAEIAGFPEAWRKILAEDLEEVTITIEAMSEPEAQ